MQADPTTALACSLSTDAQNERLAWIRRVTTSSLVSHHFEGATLSLRYRRDALDDLEQIVAKERQCCPFLSFTLLHLPGEVQLTIQASGGLGDEARWLFDQFLPQPAAAPRKGCGCAPGACG